MKTKALLVVTVLVVGLGVGMLFSPTALAGNRKLMSIKAAEADARRNIVESVVGLKVRGATSLKDMVVDSDKIESATIAAVKDIVITETIYDPEKDVAKVTAQLTLGRVRNVIGKDIDYRGAKVERVGFGTSSESSAGPLRALRAAQLDAYRQMAEKVVGLELGSHTTVEDFIMKSDDLKTRTLAAVYGAKLVSFDWDQSGDCTVKMSIKPEYVRDILGQTLRGDMPELVVEGKAAQKDESAEAKGMSSAPSREIKEQSINLPAPSSEPSQSPSRTQDSGCASANSR